MPTTPYGRDPGLQTTRLIFARSGCLRPVTWTVKLPESDLQARCRGVIWLSVADVGTRVPGGDLAERGDVRSRVPEGDLSERGDVGAGVPEGDLAEREDLEASAT